MANSMQNICGSPLLICSFCPNFGEDMEQNEDDKYD